MKLNKERREMIAKGIDALINLLRNHYKIEYVAIMDLGYIIDHYLIPVLEDNSEPDMSNQNFKNN